MIKLVIALVSLCGLYAATPPTDAEVVATRGVMVTQHLDWYGTPSVRYVAQHPSGVYVALWGVPYSGRYVFPRNPDDFVRACEAQRVAPDCGERSVGLYKSLARAAAYFRERR